jgi:hypothetical protein
MNEDKLGSRSALTRTTWKTSNGNSLRNMVGNETEALLLVLHDPILRELLWEL